MDFNIFNTNSVIGNSKFLKSVMTLGLASLLAGPMANAQMKRPCDPAHGVPCSEPQGPKHIKDPVKTPLSQRPPKREYKREKKLFFSTNATEADITFDSEIKFTTASSDTPSRDEVKEKIQDQITYLFGPMAASDSWGEQLNLKIGRSVPKGDANITLKRGAGYVENAGKSAKSWTASYTASLTILVEKMNSDDDFRLILPISPQSIYSRSKVAGKYPCTDKEHWGKDDFWYFWNPYQKGCQLEEDKDFVIVKPSQFERSKNTKKTYPEYTRLADENGVIRIDVLMGMDDQNHSINPRKSADVNSATYKGVIKNLKDMGFFDEDPRNTDKGILSREEVKALLEKLSRGKTTFDENKLPFVQELEMNIDNPHANKLKVRLFFGPSEISDDSKPFHYFYRDAVENASLLVYDGHSGLGGNLNVDPTDVESLEKQRSKADGYNFKINFNKSRYQIFFFNSCTSYRYYNTQYFHRKKSTEDENGTKNLDIVTTGLATAFDSMAIANNTLISAVVNYGISGEQSSYQEIIPAMESDNIAGINGDEDNPNAPVK